MLRVLIILPEDDKANDYFLVPDPNKPGYFLLIRIDNERAFFSPEYIHEGWYKTHSELNVKSIIFCLEQMTASWEALAAEDHRLIDYRQHILRLVPAECFENLLREASDLHDQWYMLFSTAEAQRIAQAGLVKGEIVLPVMMVVPDCEKALLDRFYLIQQAWGNDDNPLIGLPLVGSVQPILHDCYAPLFKSDSTASARFEAGPGKLYKQDKQGGLRTTVSDVVSLSRQLNLAVILKLNNDPKRQATLLGDLIQQIQHRLQYSPTQALQGVWLWQRKTVLMMDVHLFTVAGSTVKQRKNHYSAPTTNETLSDQKESTIYNQITTDEVAKLHRDFQEQYKSLLITSERTALLKRVGRKFAAGEPKEEACRLMVAQTILTTLTMAPVEQLSLTPFCKIVTDPMLIPILKRSGQQLLSLDISHCTLLSPRILGRITQYCHNLHYLKARHLTWTDVVIERWSHLTSLDLGYSSMRTLIVSQVPQLKKIKLRQCQFLTSLAHNNNVRAWRRTRAADQLPKLQQLDIRDCPALSEIKLLPQQFNRLQCQWLKSHPGVLVDWLRFLYDQRRVSETDLFKYIEILLSSPTTGLVDFTHRSSITTDHMSRERLVLSSFHHILNNELLIAILKCTGDQLLSLTMNDCSLITADIFQTLNEYCPQLHHLEVQGLSWQSLTNGTDNIFTCLNAAMIHPEKTLDLSEIKINQNALEILHILLRWNLPIHNLIIMPKTKIFPPLDFKPFDLQIIEPYIDQKIITPFGNYGGFPLSIVMENIASKNVSPAKLLSGEEIYTLILE